MMRKTGGYIQYILFTSNNPFRLSSPPVYRSPPSTPHHSLLRTGYRPFLRRYLVMTFCTASTTTSMSATTLQPSEVSCVPFVDRITPSISPQCHQHYSSRILHHFLFVLRSRWRRVRGRGERRGDTMGTTVE